MWCQLFILISSVAGVVLVSALSVSQVLPVIVDHSDWPLSLDWYVLLIPSLSVVLGVGAVLHTSRSICLHEPDRLLHATPYMACTSICVVGWSLTSLAHDKFIVYGVAAAFLVVAALCSVAVHIVTRAWRNGRRVVIVDVFASSLVVSTALGASLMSVAAAQAIPSTPLLVNKLVEHVAVHIPAALLITLLVVNTKDPIIAYIAAAGVLAYDSNVWQSQDDARSVGLITVAYYVVLSLVIGCQLIYKHIPGSMYR